MPTVDIHTHFFPPSWPDLAKRYGTPDWPWLEHTEPGKAMVMVGETEFRPVYDACWDAERRLEEMDRDGINLQIICATPVLFAYGRPAEHAADCAALFNDALLELCARGQGRLRALCQVPLQDVDRACAELSRCRRNGHIGVQIGNHVGEKNLDDEGMVAFLQHCAGEDAPVLVHPWDMLGADRTARYMMGWTVGMPAETELAIASMILGGSFERIPRSLRLCFAHGGGSFPWLLGRLDNAWRRRDIARGHAPQPPSAYLDRFHVDSAVFDPRALKFLVDVMGEDRVMLGSDYPFPLGEESVGALIRTSDLPESSKTKLLGDNALRFFNLGAA